MKTPIQFSIAFTAAVLLSGCATAPHKSELSSNDARAQLEILRSDFNAGKIRALNEVMKLTVAEADKFWPIYRRYEAELASVSDRKLALLSEFMKHHKGGTLSDDNSNSMASAWLANVQDRLDLWKKYHLLISDALSPVRAAQFLQVENQMAIFVDLNIATAMPVIGK
jgi:hypothetical protein